MTVNSNYCATGLPTGDQTYKITTTSNPSRMCCCTGYLYNPGGVCCMDLLKSNTWNVTVPFINTPKPDTNITPPTFQEMQNFKINVLERVEAQEHTINEIQKAIEVLSNKIDNDLENTGEKPHQCPACDGFAKRCITDDLVSECNACEGKGVLWG